jgi:hypothetical protein
MHVDPLMAQQVHARSPMQPSTPIVPQERSRAHCEGVQQDTHLAWFPGGAALPLALLAQPGEIFVADQQE